MPKKNKERYFFVDVEKWANMKYHFSFPHDVCYTKWAEFKYNTWPNMLEKLSLYRYRHGVYSWFYLNVLALSPRWEDANQDHCDAWLACYTCGKGTIR